MNYTLMHKNVAVIDFELDDATSSIKKLLSLHRPNHLPVGTLSVKGLVDRGALNSWWIDRSIPASRSGVREALDAMRVPNVQALLPRCFGLSLSDQYWVKPQGSGMRWEDINFFDNPFSEDIGDVLVGKAVGSAQIDFRSPDNTSDGFLRKRWKIIEGKRCLLKMGSAPFMQQPFNEVIASIVARRLGIPHVPYSLLWDDGVPYSVCEDFITPDTELVSAWRVMQTAKKDNSTSLYRHYLNCCEALGVSGIAHAIDQMIVLDYLISNEDRHLNNFGLVRDANTLEWIGVAPIFDSGSSLGYDKLTSQLGNSAGVECKPFKRTHEEQVKLVTSFGWLDMDSLQGIEDEIHQVFAQAGDYIDRERVEAIVAAFSRRKEQLGRLAEGYSREDDLSRDVAKDVARDYLM